MEWNELECALEAVLFAAGEPVPVDKLCTVLGVGEESLHGAAKSLADFYDFNRRGVKLVRLEQCYQMCSRADYAEPVRHALETRRAASLSAAALEVLAIVAYGQPTTKTYVEQVRGVDSAYTVGSLCEKGLIEECGRLDVPGRPILYRTTDVFLRSFGLSTLTELPELAEFEEEMQQLTFPQMQEEGAGEEAKPS